MERILIREWYGPMNRLRAIVHLIELGFKPVLGLWRTDTMSVYLSGDEFTWINDQ